MYYNMKKTESWVGYTNQEFIVGTEVNWLKYTSTEYKDN